MTPLIANHQCEAGHRSATTSRHSAPRARGDHADRSRARCSILGTMSTRIVPNTISGIRM